MGLGLAVVDCLALSVAVWIEIRPLLIRYLVFAVIGMRLIADSLQYLFGGGARSAATSSSSATSSVSGAVKARGTSLRSSSVSVVSPQSSQTPTRYSSYSASATPPQRYQVSSPPVPPPASKFASFPASSPAAAANVTMPLHHMSPYSGITYQCSIRDDAQIDGPNVNADFQEVALHAMALHELKAMQMTVRRMESLAEHMRSFLAQDILRPLCNQLRDNDAEFVAMRAALLKDAQFSQTVAGTVIAACSPDDPVAIAAKFQEHLGSLPQLQSLLEKRRLLDKSLTIARPSEDSLLSAEWQFPVDYVRSRLIALSSDSLMGDYHWDRGVPYKGKDWNPDLAPTDSQLLLHIFAKWIDEQVVPQDSFSRTCLAYRPAHSRAPRKAPNSVLIEQTNVVPPYFVVVANVGGKVSEKHPIPGRHVLFNTLALFIDHINKHCGGKICRCRIASLARTRSSRIALQQSEDSDASSNNSDYEY